LCRLFWLLGSHEKKKNSPGPQATVIWLVD
jgi:hypothetical protein